MRILKTALILSVISVLCGCATTQSENFSEEPVTQETPDAYAATTLPVTEKLRFSDVPVPAGFKLDQNKSFVFQTEDTRVALLKYTGRAKLQDLVEFFKEQLLLYNWELLNIVEYGKSVLNFERGRQSCIITIDSQGMKKTVIISLAPKAKGSLKTETESK